MSCHASAASCAYWQRHLHPVICHVGKRPENNYHTSPNQFCVARSSPLRGGSLHLQEPWKSPSANVPRPLFNHLQQLGISSSRNLQADSSALTPVPSLLIPGLASNDGTDGTTEKQKDASKPATVQAVLKGIKQSPNKVNLVAALVRGMRVEDALLQLQLIVKRASKFVYQVIHSAKANATHNHGLDPDRLLVAEAFTGKGYFKKRVSYHAKGKCGTKERPECRLTVVVREITVKEEAEIARLRVSNLRKLSKRERRLVPHKLIETTPVWDRESRRNNQHGDIEV